MYFRAWDAIQFDRSYGMMGGQTPITYMTMSRYAADHGISGSDFTVFRNFMSVLDGAHLELCDEDKPPSRG